MRRVLRSGAAAVLLGVSVAGQAGPSPTDGDAAVSESGRQAEAGDCNLLKGFFGGPKRSAGVAPSDIGSLIRRTRTAGSAEERARMIHRLGELDCRRHPEVLAALVHSLSDVDGDVRAEAAGAIGETLEDGRCGDSREVVAALTCALADCDESVREEAKDALKACGHEVERDGVRGGRSAAVGDALALPASAPPVDPAQVSSHGHRPSGGAGSLAALFGLGR